jgi:hypothetical protein
MATKEELQKQLATIEAGLLDFTAVGEQAYLKQTGQTKLKAKKIPTYSSIYDPIYKATKDVQFSLGADARTSATGDRAFYVFNPAVEAEKQTQKKLADIETFNTSVKQQEENIKKFLASEKETAKTAVLQSYLSTMLNPQLKFGERNPFEWEAVDINTREGFERFQKTRERIIDRPIYSGSGNTPPTYYVKLTAEEAAAKKKLTESIERMRFMASPTLQKTYAEKYRAQLQAQLKKMK